MINGNVINELFNFLTNKMLVSVIIAFVLSQVIKIGIDYYKNRRWTIITDGGMPSSHSATVSALTMSVYLIEGASSLFVVSLFISLIVLYDAQGVRFQSGEHARYINKIAKLNGVEKLRERLGHTRIEVVVGVILGIIVAVLVNKVW